jgi:Flp pilus assembly pilin Flp
MRISSKTKQGLSKKRITGQGMTEYIIIVALIALASILAVGFFGSAVKTQFVAMSNKLVGQTGDVTLDAAPDTAASDLGTYQN